MQQTNITGSTCFRASAFPRLCQRGATLLSFGRPSWTQRFAVPSFKLGNPISGRRNALDVATQRIQGGRSERPAAGGARRVAVVWFRNDLRVHDNEALAMANRESTSLLPVYCFDPREYSSAANGINSTGPYRAQFIVDAVTELRENLRAIGSDLIVRVGKPEEVLTSLAKKVGASKVYCHCEVSYEEDLTEKRVAAALKTENVQLKGCWGSTLYSPDDLPFKLCDMPPTHGEFRSRIAALTVKQPEKAPSQLKGKPLGCQGIAAGDIPTLAQLGSQPVTSIPGAPKCRGGENVGLAQLDRLLSNISLNAGHENTMGASFSNLVSPWLSLGCLSPRRMYAEVQARQSSTNTAIAAAAHAELVWRDFFRFTAKKYASDSIYSSAARQGAPVKTAAPPTLAMACA